MQGTDWTKVIDALATKLSVPAAQLWAVLLRQARIDALEASVWLIASVGYLVWLATKGRRWVVATSAHDRELRAIANCILGVIALLIANTASSIVLRGFFNPEYAALHYLLNAAK